jgi:hypothetical protein
MSCRGLLAGGRLAGPTRRAGPSRHASGPVGRLEPGSRFGVTVAGKRRGGGERNGRRPASMDDSAHRQSDSRAHGSGRVLPPPIIWRPRGVAARAPGIQCDQGFASTWRRESPGCPFRRKVGVKRYRRPSLRKRRFIASRVMGRSSRRSATTARSWMSSISFRYCRVDKITPVRLPRSSITYCSRTVLTELLPRADKLRLIRVYV